MSKQVAIFLAGQHGDQMTAMSCLKFKEELWGSDCHIIWYSSKENMDLFAHQDIEVREFPRGYGYPEMVVEENRKLFIQGLPPAWEDFLPLVDENNMLNIELAKSYPSLAGIDIGYFPAPHQVPMSFRNGLNYPLVSKKVFKIPDEYEWHPVLKFSDEERQNVKEFIDSMGEGKKVLVETFAGSGQSVLDESMIEMIIWQCQYHWPGCKLIFASHKYLRAKEEFPQGFFEKENIYSAKQFTVRQCALIAGHCDLILSVSSGITVAASCWENKDKACPILQFTGSAVCGTAEIALSDFEMVTADYKPFEKARDEYQDKLLEMLNKYK